MGTDAGAALLLPFGARGPALRRLFCVPFAGGGPATYRRWPQDLPADVEVVAVRLPGRGPGATGPLLDSVGEIVEAVLPAIEATADLPFAVFGHSMGALIAFELTIALEAAGGPAPAHLFVSGRRPPDAGATSRIGDLPDEAFLDALDEHFGGVPEAVRREPELLALLLPALRADVRTFESYEPSTDRRVRCPVHVYGGADDVHPRPAELDGWQRFAEQPISVRVLPGAHFYLTSATTALLADVAGRWASVRSTGGVG